MSSEAESALRREVSAFRPLLALSMVMTSTTGEDEVLRLATSAVASLGPFRTEAVHLDGGWWSHRSIGTPQRAADLERRLAELGRADGPIELSDARWMWAYPLVSVELEGGHVVVAADGEPEPHQQFLLGVLVQQTSAALTNARLHARQRATAERLAEANTALEHAVARAERSAAAAVNSLTIHDRLTRVAVAGEGHHGLARAVHELTGRAVTIEDRYGNLVSSAGPDPPAPYPKRPAAERERLLNRLAGAGGPLRDHGRLLIVARGGDDDVGVIALSEPDEADASADTVVLEHAATVLALELAHRRGIAETELRLRRDLVEDLLAGTDLDSARERAHALGYDLDRPHRIVVVAGSGRREGTDALFHAARRAARDHGIGSLLVARSGVVAILSDADGNWHRFRDAVIVELGPGGSCRVGVSAPCTGPQEFPRAYGEAHLALKMQASTSSPAQVTVFEDLGVYKLLSEIADVGSVEAFIQRWLGSLLDYDARRGGQLVETLAGYLERGGNYDATAHLLSMHRSTLRYRLQRVRQISGHDLAVPDTRFNLQLATRAWATIRALQQP